MSAPVEKGAAKPAQGRAFVPGAHHISILRSLSEHNCGWLTGEVAARVLPHNYPSKSMRSSACRRWLLELQRAGLVAPTDNKKPVVWIRTKAGSELLEEFGS